MKRILTSFLLLGLFLTASPVASAQTGVTVLARPALVGTVTGSMPEVDGIADINLQKSINAVLKAKFTELTREFQTDCLVDFQKIFNKPTIFTVMLKATDGSRTAYKGVSIDTTTGKECRLEDFFRDEAFLGKIKAEYEDLIFGETGLYARKFKNSRYEDFMSYTNFMRQIKISEADRLLAVHWLTSYAGGSVLRMKEGELAVLDLEANRTQGYSWALAQESEDLGVFMVGKSFIMFSHPQGQAGSSSGRELLYLGVDKPGIYEVRINYRRQWEKYPLKSLVFDMKVEGLS